MVDLQDKYLGDGLDKIEVFSKLLTEILEEEVPLEEKIERFESYKELYREIPNKIKRDYKKSQS